MEHFDLFEGDAQTSNADIVLKFKEIDDTKQTMLESCQAWYVVKEELYLDAMKSKTDGVINKDLFVYFQEEYKTQKQGLIRHVEYLKENLESRADYNEIRRLLHSLRGGVNTIGFERIGETVHFIETLFGRYFDYDNESRVFLLNKANEYLKSIYVFFEDYQFDELDFALEERDQIDDRGITVSLGQINQIIEGQERSKIANNRLLSIGKVIDELLFDLSEITVHLGRNIKELEHYADGHIQSYKQGSKVDFDPLLMDRYTKLQELHRSLSENYLDIEDLAKSLNNAFVGQQANITQISSEIGRANDVLLNMRLVHFGEMRKRFETTVKKVAEKLGKKVDFELRGEDVLIDVTLPSKINGAIEHIIRNALSHGIELEEERIKKGKLPKGKIIIEARQQANSLFLKISDDGAGLQVEKIKQKAIEKGFISPTAKFEVKDAVQFILMPNFSTADANAKANKIAGMGVGMDVVQSEILGLGGSFNVSSIEGQGMSVDIQLPTTYATSFGLVCRVGNEKIILPNEIIKEFISLNIENYEARRVNETFEYKGQYILSKHLGEILKLPFESKRLAYVQLIVLEHDGEMLAIEVDEVIENKEIIVQHVDNSLRSVPGLIGVSTILDGTPVFVFNPIVATNYVREYQQSNAFKKFDKIYNEKSFFVPTVLIVDDSPVIRKHTERFLMKQGYKYISAKNGRDALDKMTGKSINVILLDIEMPEMNGFEFARIVKGSEEFKSIPIIMITSRSNDIHRNEAKGLGVDDYLIKPFVEDELAAILKRKVGNG